MTKLFSTICGAGVLLTLSGPTFAHPILLPTSAVFATKHKHAMHHPMHRRMAMHSRMTVRPTRERNTNGKMIGKNSIMTPAMKRRSVTPPAAITNNGQANTGASAGTAGTTRP